MSTLSIEQANTYFAAHLDKSKWEALTDDQKTGALTMGEIDVCNKLGKTELIIDNTNMVNACYEQAIYLAINHDKLNNPDVVTKTYVSGMGSREYSRSAGSGFSPRAILFIKRITGNTIRFNRG